jgi:Neuraminidase (sialidase)
MYWLAPAPEQGCPSTAVAAAHYSSSSSSSSSNSSGVRRRRHGTAALWLVRGRDGVKVTRLCADVTDELTAAVCGAVELSGAVSVPLAKQKVC